MGLCEMVNVGFIHELPGVARWVLTFGAAHEYLVYAALVLLACAEGPWVTLTLGVFVKLGYFSFLPVYGALILGDLIGDAGWYWIGRRYGHRFIDRYGRYFHVTEEGVARMTRLFHRYKDSILFLSKISNGLGLDIVTLTTAGMVRIPLGRFMLVNLLGQFIWTGSLLAVGYFFTQLFDTVNNVLGRISLVAAAAVLVLIGYRLWKCLRRRAEGPDAGPPTAGK
jgi:membrane-associated protein